MKSNELKDAIAAKTSQLELAMELGKPKELLMHIYKELKELHFQLIQEDLHEKHEELLWHTVAGATSLFKK